jgi:hypothetical protein
MSNNHYSKIRTYVGVITLIILVLSIVFGVFNKFVLADIRQNKKDIIDLKIVVSDFRDIKEDVKWMRRNWNTK